VLLKKTDAEVRRQGYRSGLETPVVLAENDVCCCVDKLYIECYPITWSHIIDNYNLDARISEGVKHTTWEVWSQGGNPNH
jgi:hypothetical protein